jgi:hypothetical protein
MLKDFSSAFADFLNSDGSMKMPITFYHAFEAGPIHTNIDPDGIIVTVTVHSIDTEEPCLLTMLFPMPLGAAEAKLRQGRLPVLPSSAVTVRRKIDEVVGDSGERYSRFAVDVQ